MVKKERNLKERVWRSTTHIPISLSVASLICISNQSIAAMY